MAKQIKISNVMVVQPPKREAIDIHNYTRSIKSADRGKRRQLYDVYENIIKDPVLAESIRKRVRHITNGGLKFSVEGETNTEMDDLIQQPEFRKLIREIFMTRFYGKSVFELDFEKGFSVHLLPRRYYDTKEKKILKSYFDTEGWSYEDNDFLLNVGEDDDLGFLMESAPFAIFKRNGGADYAEFCELWGIPILAALYDPDDDNARQEMEETLLKRGAGGSIVASKNSEISTIDTQKTGAVHKEFLDWLDEQILIGTIGQTMTSKDGASHSQSKVHADVEDDINEDDQVYVLEVLNHQLLPKLEKRGYPVSKGYFIYPERDNLSLQEKIEIAEKVDENTEHGVDDEYWYEITGIPKGNKDPNRPRKGQGNPFDLDFEVDEETGLKVKNLKIKKHGFFNALKDFFGNAPR